MGSRSSTTFPPAEGLEQAHGQLVREADFDAALEAGLSALSRIGLGMAGGGELEQACKDLDARLARTGDALSTALVRVAAQAARNLLGRTPGKRSLSGDGFDERELDALAAREDFSILSSFLDVTRCMLAIVHGDLEEALAHAERVEATSARLEFFRTHFSFFMAIARLGTRGLEGLRGGPLAGHLERLARLAESCPENYGHLDRAASAELARLEGRHADARELYDDAHAAAKTNDLPHHEAIIAELAARYYFNRDKPHVAQVYLARARDGYARWGARAKVAELERTFEGAIRAGPQSAGGYEEVTVTSARALDAVAVVRAAEALAGEIDLSKLLERIMRTSLELAGADHVALALAREGALAVVAAMDSAPEELRIGLSSPLDQSPDVAPEVARHVAGTRAPLAATSPAEDARFAKDPRIAARKPASILGLPLVHRGELAGVIYLEHGGARGVFGKDRVEVLGLLSSQVAIAVENALLVADVRARTNELGVLNIELVHELEERKRTERDRAALQQGIIEMQRARLAELRTPFIPVSHDVMVMPLVGTLDGPRAEEALLVALAGTTARRARVVILDVTGVKVVDEHVARTLLKMVDALGLLGAAAVVTGIRGDVARTLVEIDADFSAKVTTKSTLEAGIRHAFGEASRRH